MEERSCIMCSQLIEDEEYYTDISLGTYWCVPCGDKELEKRQGNEGELK